MISWCHPTFDFHRRFYESPEENDGRILMDCTLNGSLSTYTLMLYSNTNLPKNGLGQGSHMETPVYLGLERNSQVYENSSSSSPICWSLNRAESNKFTATDIVLERSICEPTKEPHASHRSTYCTLTAIRSILRFLGSNFVSWSLASHRSLFIYLCDPSFITSHNLPSR